jgi:thymidine phosphorylase
VVLPVPALQAGRLSAMCTREIGMIVVALGGGRAQPGDAIDPRVGLSAMRGLGELLDAGEPLAFVHAADRASAEVAAARLQAACSLTPAEQPWQATPLVMSKIKENPGCATDSGATR